MIKNEDYFSFWDLLTWALKSVHYKLQDHYCFKLFLVYFARCDFQVLRLKAQFFFAFEDPLLEALIDGIPVLRHLHWNYLGIIAA